MVVGAHLDDDGVADAGSAYVYRYNGTTWVEQVKLTASDASSVDYFGGSVAINNDTVVIGAYFDDDGATNTAIGPRRPS